MKPTQTPGRIKLLISAAALLLTVACADQQSDGSFFNMSELASAAEAQTDTGAETTILPGAETPAFPEESEFVVEPLATETSTEQEPVATEPSVATTPVVVPLVVTEPPVEQMQADTSEPVAMELPAVVESPVRPEQPNTTEPAPAEPPVVAESPARPERPNTAEPAVAESPVIQEQPNITEPAPEEPPVVAESPVIPQQPNTAEPDTLEPPVTTEPPTETAQPSTTGSLRSIPEPIYGVTLDAVNSLASITESVSTLSKRPTVRVVFDEWIPATEYTKALNALYPESYIMGEILDSFYVKDYSEKQYAARVKEYLDAHADKVDIWEIGNEVNGEWLGNPEKVALKITDAYQQVKNRGYRTALTLYYNKDCWMYPWEEMFNWTEAYLSNVMRTGLDYVLVSYYEQDCNNLKPDWQSVFDRLGKMFPRAKLGFGEVGTTKSGQKADYLRRYYNMPINHPRYIGGHFWWYFKQDMVPNTKPLWSTLDSVLQSSGN